MCSSDLLPGRGSGFESVRRAQLLTQLKSSMEVYSIRGDAGCKGLKTRRIKLQEFCERLATLAIESGLCSGGCGQGPVFWEQIALRTSAARQRRNYSIQATSKFNFFPRSLCIVKYLSPVPIPRENRRQRPPALQNQVVPSTLESAPEM